MDERRFIGDGWRLYLYIFGYSVSILCDRLKYSLSLKITRTIKSTTAWDYLLKIDCDDDLK